LRPDIKRHLDQFVKMGAEGLLGDEVKRAYSSQEVSADGLSRCAQFVASMYQDESSRGQFAPGAGDLFCQGLLALYRDAKATDTRVAYGLAASPFEDYPGTESTCLFPRWVALAEATFAAKKVSFSEDFLLVTQQNTRLVLAFNEFVNGLLGFLIMAQRCALGKQVDTRVFAGTYGSRLHEFEQLTGGDNGAFYLLFRIADPKLRNAIAHEKIWFDRDKAEVRYRGSARSDTLSRMDTAEFLTRAAMGCSLGQGYVAATATVVVMESGNPPHISTLPSHLTRVYWGKR